MTYTDFVDVYKDAPPAKKLDLLLEANDIYAHSRVMTLTAAHNFNHQDQEYYSKETDHMSRRIQWLYNELKKTLGGVK